MASYVAGWFICILTHPSYNQAQHRTVLIKTSDSVNLPLTISIHVEVKTATLCLLKLWLYQICFWEIRPEPDFARFVKQIQPEPVPEPDFTI